MKTLKTFLLALVTLLTVTTSFSQTTHTFYVDATSNVPGVFTVPDTTVEVGDVIEFVNSVGGSASFTIEVDGGTGTTTSTIGNGGVIYSYTLLLSDLGTMDVEVYNGMFTRQYVHFTVVNPTTTGIEDVSDVTFSVFPNPTTNFLNISTSDNIESVKVFDMNGRLVISDTYNTSDVKLDVMNLTNGYYTVLVNNIKPIKFIKN